MKIVISCTNQTIKNTFHLYIKNKLKIKNNSIIFYYTDYVEEFLAIKKNGSINNLILITSQSDKASIKNYGTVNQNNFKWFAINSEVDNENLINIPLGLGNAFLKKILI